MFCMKCGATLEDGAKFCPQCGASQEAAAPAAPPPPPVSSAAGTPAQPHRSSIDRQQQAGWQQPVQKPVYQQPAQQPSYQQPPYQPPAPPPKKKKKHTGLIVLLIIILAAAAAGFLFRSKISSFVLSNVAPAEKYYEHVEKNSIADFSANTAEAYDLLLLSNTNINNKTGEGSLEVQLGDAGRDLLMTALGSTLQQLNPDEDLKWLKSLGLSSGVVTQDDKSSLQLQLNLNSVGLVTLNLVADPANDKVCISIPQLKEGFLEMPLSQLDAMSDGGGITQIFGMMSGLAQMDSDKLAGALKSMPSKSVMEQLIQKYLNMLLECAEEVEKEKGELTVEGVSEDATILTLSADGETLAKALQNIFTEMKKDNDIKSIITGIAEARETDAAGAYKEFQDSLDEAMADLDEVKQSSGFDMTVYTNAGGEIIGREIHGDGITISMKKPEQGDKFGLEIILGAEGSALTLKGDGKKSGDKLTGELDLEADGTFMGVVALDGFDEEKLKKGMLSGAIEIRPSDALLGSMGSDSLLSSVLRDLAIRLEMDTGRDKGSCTLSILNGSGNLLKVSANMNAKAGGKVSSVTGEDMEKWSSGMDPQSFLSTLVDSLKKAGVPEAYTSLLSSLN